MLHKEFFGFLFLGFIAWIFIASTPMQRIENLCKPVGWVGNATVSMSALIVPSHQVKVQSWFDKLEYGCQFITWRMVYQKEYNTWLATQGKPPVDAPETPIFDLKLGSGEDLEGSAAKEAPSTESPFGNSDAPYVPKSASPAIGPDSTLEPSSE